MSYVSGFSLILGRTRLGVVCGIEGTLVVCEVRDSSRFGFAIEVMCNLLLSRGMASRVPRSPDVEVYRMEEEALFAASEPADSQQGNSSEGAF